MPDCPRGGLRANRSVGLGEDAPDVIRDGTLRDHELVGNLAVATTSGDEAEDFDFAGAETGIVGRFA